MIAHAWTGGPLEDEARFGLVCAARILLRSRPLGLVDTLDLDGLEAAAAPAIGWLGEESAVPDLQRRALRDLLRLFERLRRERGEVGSLASRLPAPLRSRAIDDPDWSQREIEVLVALDPGAGEQRWAEALECWPAPQLGTLAGLLGGAERLREARAALEARGAFTPAARADFEHACTFYTEDLTRAESDYMPDEDTRLGAPWDGPPSALLSLQEGSSMLDALSYWDFTQGACGAQAGPAILRQATMREHPRFPDSIRMGRFGESTVELFFAVDEPLDVDPVLVLDHLAARREYLLHGGEAHLAVELDGIPLAEVRVLDSLRSEHRLPVYRSYLTPGQHTLTIRCGPGSTTTYWLYRVLLLDR